MPAFARQAPPSEAEQPQIGRGAREGGLRVAREPPLHVARRQIERLGRIRKAHGRRAERRRLAGFDGSRDFANPGDFAPHRFAARERQLAVHQVNAVDAVGAFVDRGDPGVPHVLRRAGLFDEAHAAVDLHAERGRFVADVGRERLGDRGQQRRAIGAAARSSCVRPWLARSSEAAVRWQIPRAA